MIGNCWFHLSHFSRFICLAGIYVFKEIITIPKLFGEICSKLIKTPEPRQWLRSAVFIIDFEQISSHIVLLYPTWLWTSKCRLGNHTTNVYTLFDIDVTDLYFINIRIRTTIMFQQNPWFPTFKGFFYEKLSAYALSPHLIFFSNKVQLIMQ